MTLNLKKDQSGQKNQHLKSNLKVKIFSIIAAFIMPLQLAFAEVATKKSESSVVLGKFGFAIGLVLFFALVLYFMLYLYKKVIINKNHTQTQYTPSDSLEPAKNIDEAIQIFLEKTKPNQ